MLINDIVLASLRTPVRTVEGRAEVYNSDGSTAYSLRSDSYLKEFKVERIGDNTKFFGYGFVHKANVKARDVNREIELSTSNTVLPYFIDRTSGEPVEIKTYPKMNITEVNRDENTNELSITCYDALYKATKHKVEELALTVPYTIQEFVVACASLLGISGVTTVNVTDDCFSVSYPEGANFEGTETIRDALNAAAEATQTIYYIDSNNILVFKRLDISGDAVFNIEKADYIQLDSKTNRRLATLVSATELGDSLGTTHKVYNKNMADYHQAVNPAGETFTEVDNGYVIDVSGEDYKRISFIPLNKELKAGTYYVISYDWVNIGTEETSSVACYLPDIEQYLSNGVAFTPKEDTQKIGIYLQAADVGKDIQVEITNIQLEEGTAATDYVPYGYYYLTGTTQYIRDNPFWDLREDRTTLLENALAAVGGLTINQFECNWRGNYLLEIGDKISLETKDNNTVYSYILDDTIHYNGALSEATQWNYTDNEEETEATPTTLGDAIKQTYAKVDKANKQIEIVASETNANSEAIAAIRLDTDSINASVSKVAEDTTAAIEAANSSIATLTTKVDASITAENVQLVVQKELENGVEKVTTSTGFTFDDEGLTVSKTNSEIKTQITEDGMSVYKNEEEVLTANNEGVKAANLHATTYLIIGNYSRFEDYTNADGEARTGCFWIGD